MVRSGQLRPLSIAQRLHWSEGQCLDFLDSIARSFPVGSLTMGGWYSESQATIVHSISQLDSSWILDGWQRISSLLDALLPPPAGASLQLSSWTFVRIAQVEVRQFELPGISVASVLPVSILFSLEGLSGWLRLHPQPPDIVRRLFALGEQLRTYQIPVWYIHLTDTSKLSLLLERIHGIQLDIIDRFCLKWQVSENKEGPLLKIVRSLQPLGFGELEEEIALKTLKVLLVDMSLADDDGFSGLLRSAESALRRAIIFLQVNAGIPHSALLPYSLTLIVLARFFSLYSNPSAESRELLRQWLWRGALGLALGGHGARYLDAIQTGGEHASAQKLIALVPDSFTEEVSRLDRFHITHARSRLQLCALASLRPRHINGQELDISAFFSASSSLIPTLVESSSSPLAQGIANRILLPKEVGLIRTLVGGGAEVLSSHGIEKEALEALLAGDMDRFLLLRGQTLRELFRRYFMRQADVEEVSAGRLF